MKGWKMEVKGGESSVPTVLFPGRLCVDLPGFILSGKLGLSTRPPWVAADPLHSAAGVWSRASVFCS